MFFLFFIGIPLIEVMLFITIGKYIGLWNTILIIIITGTNLHNITMINLYKKRLNKMNQGRGHQDSSSRTDTEGVNLRKFNLGVLFLIKILFINIYLFILFYPER